jgi:hypothetical protein
LPPPSTAKRMNRQTRPAARHWAGRGRLACRCVSRLLWRLLWPSDGAFHRWPLFERFRWPGGRGPRTAPRGRAGE